MYLYFYASFLIITDPYSALLFEANVSYISFCNDSYYQICRFKNKITEESSNLHLYISLTHPFRVCNSIFSYPELLIAPNIFCYISNQIMTIYCISNSQYLLIFNTEIPKDFIISKPTILNYPVILISIDIICFGIIDLIFYYFISKPLKILMVTMIHILYLNIINFIYPNMTLKYINNNLFLIKSANLFYHNEYG